MKQNKLRNDNVILRKFNLVEAVNIVGVKLVEKKFTLFYNYKLLNKNVDNNGRVIAQVLECSIGNYFNRFSYFGARKICQGL